MNISSRIQGNTQIVSVNEGRIDAAAAIRFKDRVREETGGTSGTVILDLSQVDFVDSSGLGAIVATMKHLGSGRRMDLAGLTENVDKVFRLTRMNTIFKIHETLETALECHV